MLDPFGKLLLELRTDGTVGALTDRIRGHEPGPDDAKGPGEYRRFVVIQSLGTIRARRGLPLQTPRYLIRCYGVTPQDAFALYAACSDAVHDEGPRVHSNALGIYISHDDTGGTDGADPRTGQPYVEFVVELTATTTAVAA